MNHLSILLASAPTLIPLLEQHLQGGVLFTVLVGVTVWASRSKKE